MWYVYVLESFKTGRKYTGSTSDLKRRLSEHNSGNGGKYSERNGPYKLIFFEGYLEKKDALESEKFFKTGYGREVLEGKLKSYLSSK